MNLTEITPRIMLTIASDLTPEWIAGTRYAASLPGFALRSEGLCIEAINYNGMNEWQRLLLPSGGHDFATQKDRDEILEALGWKQ